MSHTVSGLIVTPHNWVTRSTLEILDLDTGQFPGGAKTTLLNGNTGTAEFCEVNEYDNGIAVAIQYQSHPGYSPTNWIPNIVATVIEQFLRKGSFANEDRISLDQITWGDAFVMGHDTIDGEIVYRDLTPGEEDKIMKALNMIDHFYF